jgi:teichuronic acid biosynthesis glycosyltransferase TuaC
MNVLSLSSVYPNPQEPGLGLFVRARLQHMADFAKVQVVAPIPVLDYSNPKRKLLPKGIPAQREDSRLTVTHPRWLYPPGGTPLNVLCLFLWLLSPIAGIRRKFAFDLIDAHFGYPEGVVAALIAKMLRCPFVVTLRGSEPVFARSWCRDLCLRWALRRADAVIAVSESLRAFAIRAGADPDKIRTIPNGIDTDVFVPADRALCRQAYGIAPGTLAVMCAGELIEAKGHHLVVRAMSELRKEGLNVELFLAGGVARGGRPFDNQLRSLVSELKLEGRVHLLGWIDQHGLARLMTAADVFCLASYTEGWPNVVNEALACGAPVVATQVGAVPDMIPSREFGYVVPARDEAALTSALRRSLLRDWDRDAIAKWGRSRSWEQTGREVIDLISECVMKAYVRN